MTVVAYALRSARAARSRSAPKFCAKTANQNPRAINTPACVLCEKSFAAGQSTSGSSSSVVTAPRSTRSLSRTFDCFSASTIGGY